MVQATPLDVGIPTDFLRRRAPELARDIVSGLDGAAKLAATYGLTPPQWEVLKTWPAFRQLVAEIREELGGSAGTLERAQRRARLAVAEFVVHDMAVISGNDKVAAKDRIAAAEVLVDIAGASAKIQQTAAATGLPVGGFGGGPLIQIVMPDGARLNVGEAAPVPSLPVIEGAAVRIENAE